MSEAEFARMVVRRLALQGRRVLRASDYRDARRGVFGLRAITDPRIDCTGADYLVLPRNGLPTVIATAWEQIAELEHSGSAFFVETKDPKRGHRKDQLEQDEWIRWVAGERRMSAVEKAMGGR